MNLGCYGSIVCHDEKSSACAECSLFLACHEVAHGTLMEIRKKFDLEHVVRKHQQFRVKRGIETDSDVVQSGKRQKLTEYQEAIVNNEKFPIKARKMLKRIFHKGIDGEFMRLAMNSGVNPFKDSTPAIMYIGCEMAMSGEFSRKQLSLAIANSGDGCMEWKSATSQASTVINTMRLMSVLDEKGEKYLLRG